MTALLQFSSSNISPFNTIHFYTCKKPFDSHHISRSNITSFDQNRFKVRVFEERWRLFGGVTMRGKGDFFVKDEGLKRKSGRRVVLVRFNQGLDDGGGGDDEGDISDTVKLLGNIALAVGLTYLSVTGQLGWVFDAVGWIFDAIISIWLLAVVLPLLGVGAFLWWVGRDMVQSNCPNCGNEFQIFKSTLNDEVQLCPYCTQPFSVVDDKFVRDPVKFSNESTPFGQAFGGFYPGSKKGRESSSAIVDVEAEVKDAD